MNRKRRLARVEARAPEVEVKPVAKKKAKKKPAVKKPKAEVKDEE